MRLLGLQWRYFWSRRAQARTLSSLICALLALCAVIYLALPAGGQAMVSQGLQQVATLSGVIGLNTILLVALVLFTVISVALLLTPEYRAYTYLIPPGGEIPSVSVYLDAESEPPTAVIPAFVTFLRQYLDGRRADLLFFTEASVTAGKPHYTELARYGFRPVDVPHDPTGVGNVKEAVDRELAMHAFERALLGPAKQEFIIITKDGDYVPLVYRLCALGHKVQVWSTRHSPPYTQLSTYLDMHFVHLSELSGTSDALPPANAGAPIPAHTRIPAMRAQRPQRKPATRKRKPPTAAKFDINGLRITIPESVQAEPGSEKLYRAVEITRLATDWYRNTYPGDATRYEELRKQAFTGLLPYIGGVGYSVGSWFDFWIEHLTAVDAIVATPPDRMPSPGPATTELATRQLRAMALAASEAAAEAVSIRPDGLIHMRAISIIMESRSFPIMEFGKLGVLVAQSETRRTIHTRYFVWLARAIGLLEFGDVAGGVDLLRSPRQLSASARSSPDLPSAEEGDANPPLMNQGSHASVFDEGSDVSGVEPLTPPSPA